MNDLTIINRSQVLYLDSREVAEVTRIRHDNLLAKISNYIRVLENSKLRFQDFFISSTYKVEDNNKTYDCYLLTRKGCDMVANKMTGDKGILFTAKYINKFYEMERSLLERQSPHWQHTRLESKSNRKMETEEIKQFVSYAKSNGSKSSDKYYINLSKLANKAVGLESNQRDIATTSQLNNLILIEHIIGSVIVEGIQHNLYYKDIYKACRTRIEQFKQVAYLQQTA